MRYADGPTAEASVTIDADAERVWALVSDITLPTRFSPELQSVEWLDGATGPSVGARFVGRSQHAAIGEWETTSIVTTYEPNSAFEWRVGDDPEFASSAWRFMIEPVDENSVKVTQWCRIGPGPSGLTMAIESMPDKEERIIERRMGEHAANMQRNLDGLKELAEANPTSA